MFEEPVAEDAPVLSAPATPSFVAPYESRRGAARSLSELEADATGDSLEAALEPTPESQRAAPHSTGVSSSFDGQPAEATNLWGDSCPAKFSLFNPPVPMEHTSWLNRPYHLDWFAGPLLSDGPVSGRVTQSNELFGGLRLGWDFDYYWGLEWRFGWSDPTLLSDTSPVELSGTYFVSDVDFLWYPWGETRVRPFTLLGLGMTQIGSVREDGSGQEATLLSMPMGVGVQFLQTHWLAWRLEIVDNLAFGGDGIDTMNNFVFTAGMELRMGARPNSYWPWRSSRTSW